MRRMLVTTTILALGCGPKPATTPPTAAQPVAPPVAESPAYEPPPLQHFAGEVRVPGTALGFAVELRSEGGKHSGTLEIPMQGAHGLPLADVEITADRLGFRLAPVDARWAITRDANTGEITGCKFTQRGLSFECGIAPIDAERFASFGPSKRPQTPKPPFAYDSVDVVFDNPSAKIQLAGTLTLPKGDGPFPAVVLATGSGAQDRDETLFEHKPFLVIADHFARSGIATLRVDDRGVGKSTGNMATATTDDFVDDALAAVTFLATQPRIDRKRIGVAGHSEGGLIAPAAAVKSKSVAFVIMIAGPGVSGRELLPKQIERVMAAEGAAADAIAKAVAEEREALTIIAEGGADEATRQRLRELYAKHEGATPETIEPEIDGALSPWFLRFLAYDPRPTLRKVKVPVLVLSGTKDVQVDTDQNVGEIEKALRKGGNRKVEVHRFDGLNHLMQHAQSGGVAEYAKIEETFAPEVLEVMTRFVATRK